MARSIPGKGRLPTTPGTTPQRGSMSSAPSGMRLRDMSGRFVTGGFGFEWTGLEGVFGLPVKFEQEIDKNLKESMEVLRRAMELYARDNAPWIDNTGDAREGLKAVLMINAGAGKYEIDLGHSVRYGVYLENSNGGAYAIVLPTVRHFASQLMANVRLHD